MSAIEQLLLSREFSYLPPLFYRNPYALRCKLGAGGAAGGTLLGVGLATRDADSGLGIAIAGSAIMYACGVAAVVLNIVGNVHIKQGGELMRRVQIKGNGISVSF